jgi:2-(1,2-epoxy-1,2-dihydrophenyl)acetyl-CoA isomerase
MGDIIVAGESAFFLEAFRRVGLVPDGGGAYLLTRAVGRARAMEMVMLGEKITAPKALEWGLINRVVPDADLQEATQKLAKDLAEGPKSLAMIRKLVWDSLDRDWNAQLVAERLAQRDAGYTKDFREGIDAFLNRRTPNFKGE